MLQPHSILYHSCKSPCIMWDPLTTLYLAMKAYRGRWGNARVLDHGVRWTWVASFMLQPFHSGPRPNAVAMTQSCLCHELKPVTCHITDWTVTARMYCLNTSDYFLAVFQRYYLHVRRSCCDPTHPGNLQVSVDLFITLTELFKSRTVSLRSFTIYRSTSFVHVYKRFAR